MKIDEVTPFRYVEVTSTLGTDEIKTLLQAVQLLQENADSLARTIHISMANGNPVLEPGAAGRAKAAIVRHKRIIHPVMEYFGCLKDAGENV